MCTVTVGTTSAGAASAWYPSGVGAREYFLEWQRETGRLAGEPLERALAAAKSGDVKACVGAAKQTALVFLQAYLRASHAPWEGGSCDLAQLLEAATRQDAYFERVRAAAALLEACEQTSAGADCDEIIDAMKEIRLLAGARGGVAMGFSVRSPDEDPRLETFVVHSTTVERAVSIFAHGTLYSYNGCVRRGILCGPAPGVAHLLDPRRCLDFVLFGIPDHMYYGGEKVANAHRKGWIDEGLEEDYQPSVRLFFRREELEALPGCEDDGIHELMVRDEVSLHHLARAVFPSLAAQQEVLAAVALPKQREKLLPLCLVAPPECCHDPRQYVRVTNVLVAKLL